MHFGEDLGLALSIFIVFLSLIWLFLISIAFFGNSKSRSSKPSKARPKVLVVVPCKGNDIDLTENLKSALAQDYKNYRAVAVIESKKDPAYKAIKKAGMDYIISDFKCTKCSGKVRSLSSAFRRFPSYELYCIFDSDVMAPTNWLSSLVAAMNPNIGIATSFPIFEPISGFWSKAKHVWGFVGMGLMENERTRFGWGGTLLFRRALIAGRNMDEFSESVSDDTALTRIAKRMGFMLAYVPEARPIVKCDDDMAKFFEWSTRQTKFALSVDKKLLYYGVAFYTANLLLLISGILIAIFYNYLGLLFLIPFVVGLAKTYKRSGSLDLSIIPIYLLIYFIYLYNIGKAKRMKGVMWRGKYYPVTD